MTTLAEAMESGYGIERSFLCHVHDDHSPSASVNSISGLWRCYSCGATGRFNMEDRYEDPYQLGRALEAMKAKQEYIPTIYSESWLNVFDALPSPYWISRFADPELVKTHRLGEDPYASYATIPMRDNVGRVLGVIRRNLSGEGAKYRYPYRVVAGHHLYNYHRLSGGVLVVTEGATDAIAAEEVGITSAVALYGSRMSTAQATLVHRYAPQSILVATDQDDAGEAAADSVQGQLGDCYPVQRLWWSDWKDLASMPVSDRAEMLDQYRSKISV